MQITFDLGSIILGSLIAQGVFVSVLLFFKQENGLANRYLSLLLLLLSLWLGDAFFRVAGVYQQDPNFYFLPIYFSLGFGPLIYFYTLSLTRTAFHLQWRHSLHFVPVLLQCSFYLYLQTQSYAYRRTFWFEVHRPYTYDLELVLSFSSMLIYLVASLGQIRSYKRSIANSFSNLDRIKLSWLWSIHLVLSVLALFWLLESLARLGWGYYPATPLSAITIGFTVLFMAAGGILQKDLRTVRQELAPEEATQTAAGDPVDPTLIERIQNTMTERKLFLAQELTLKEFALAVGTSPREVSRALNRGLAISFVDFVNGYRVAQFKALTKSVAHAHLSLLGLALESGFNSKSTFNRVFKKMEDQSPSAYLAARSPAD